VTGSSDGTARIWDLDVGECLGTLEGHTDTVDSVTLSADGRRVMTTSDDDTEVRVWDFESGECLRFLTGHTDTVQSVGG